MANPFLFRCFCAALLCCGAVSAQDVTLTARVAFSNDEDRHEKDRHKTHDAENVVFWLVPARGSTIADPPVSTDSPHPRLVQKNKSFQPHLLVVPVGTVVEFPNHDPFFHNVFSLFEGKRFDLGLYEAGTTRKVHFDKPGISYIFCNIHPEMGAVVIALDTPYYAVSDKQGEIVIPHVPIGRYALHIWYEAAVPETLNSLVREITVTENSSALGVLRLKRASLRVSHKNKYGEDYPPPASSNPAY